MNKYEEFQKKEIFRYTILSLDRKTCLGCFYIRPTRAVQYDCKVEFWFRNSAKEFEKSFFEWVQVWLKDEWQFQKVVYPGRTMSWEEYYMLVD